MSKRKEPDACVPTGISRAAGKRKIAEDENAFPDEDDAVLQDLLSLENDADDLNGLGDDDAGNDDDLTAALGGDMSDSELEARLGQKLVGRTDSEISSEIPESEPEDNVDISSLPYSENDLKTQEKLDFSGVTLTGAQARRVAQAIAENASLSTISFEGHELPIGDLTEEDELEWDSEEYTDVEAIIIAELLKKDNSTVKRLDLARNQITDNGAKALALMLEANSTLEYLNLESNMISEKGGAAFGRAVQENSTLQYLNLQYNSIPTTRQQDLRDFWQATARGQLGLHL